MGFPAIHLELPGWVEELLAGWDGGAASPAERMALAVNLARENAARGGGPFGAAVFELGEGGRLVAPGVNLVVPANCSVAHAEVVALGVAQGVRGSFDLGGEGAAACELVTSAEPCAQCMGAVVWSGVRRLVCGARREDAEAIGFDEGPVAPDWVVSLQGRGIAVERDVLRAEAAAVLAEYGRSGRIYNPSRG